MEDKSYQVLEEDTLNICCGSLGVPLGDSAKDPFFSLFAFFANIFSENVLKEKSLHSRLQKSSNITSPSHGYKNGRYGLKLPEAAL